MRFIFCLLVLPFLSLAAFADDPPVDFVPQLFNDMAKGGEVIKRSELKVALHIRIFTDILRARDKKSELPRDVIKQDEYLGYMRINAGKYQASAIRPTLPGPPPPRAPKKPREREDREREPPVQAKMKPRYLEFIPKWYRELDDDQDSQVGLYEWRRHGLPTPEFFKYDTNEDGFFTQEEFRRAEGWKQEPDEPGGKWVMKGKAIDFAALQKLAKPVSKKATPNPK